MEAKDYRAEARFALSGNWKKSILVSALAFLLGGLITGSTFLPQLTDKLANQDFATLAEYYQAVLEQYSTFHIVYGCVLITLSLIAPFIGGAIQLGYAKYLLLQQRGYLPGVDTLFSMFRYWGKGFLLMFLRGLFTSLWSLLFLIPGIIASYSYAMAPFLLSQDPEMSVLEVLGTSKEMMRGNKWKLFCLDLSFFGWELLCGLTFNVGHIVLNPYRNAAYASFYSDLCTH